jgi:hypothetical protein
MAAASDADNLSIEKSFNTFYVKHGWLLREETFNKWNLSFK